MPFPNTRPRKSGNFRRLAEGEWYCQGDCKRVVTGMGFTDANQRKVCADCAGKHASPFKTLEELKGFARSSSRSRF